jgi:hypothetical protein
MATTLVVLMSKNTEGSLSQPKETPFACIISEKRCVLLST